MQPLQGTWKPWLMARGNQFRPETPPAFDSPEFQEDLASLKQINRSQTPSQRAIADKLPRPQALEQFLLGDYALALLHEIGEHVEHLGS